MWLWILSGFLLQGKKKLWFRRLYRAVETLSVFHTPVWLLPSTFCRRPPSHCYSSCACSCLDTKLDTPTHMPSSQISASPFILQRSPPHLLFSDVRLLVVLRDAVFCLQVAPSYGAFLLGSCVTYVWGATCKCCLLSFSVVADQLSPDSCCLVFLCLQQVSHPMGGPQFHCLGLQLEVAVVLVPLRSRCRADQALHSAAFDAIFSSSI